VKFIDFGLDRKLVAGVRAMGFSAPTPIQTQVIPLILAGRDVVGLAQTGTGKTAAYILPVLQSLLHAPSDSIRVLILVPTRELADQVHHEIMALAQETNLSGLPVYGGVNINPQIDQLQQGIDIVIACPGRLLDHIERGTINLKDIQVLIVDEADRLFDMGFEPDVRRILIYLPSARQTLLFSATMSADIRHLVDDILTNPVTIQVAANAPTPTVSHVLFPVTAARKADLLIQILYLEQNVTRSVLIFTRTKKRARVVTQWLKEYGHNVTLLEGNLTQFRRTKAIDGFRKGTYQIMVATDIAARGIDVAGISHVINYDMPDSFEMYIHRIGRTGRISATGEAYTFATPRDRDAVRILKKKLKGKLEQRLIEGYTSGN
jgi:ATP-dependent RNA helicase RhlE